MMDPVKQQIMEQIDAITDKLTNIEEHMAWLIGANQRFRVGQRVEWSRNAHRKGFPYRKKVKRGTVKGINGFSIVVKLDGLKKETSYHHAFFNPIAGPKLF